MGNPIDAIQKKPKKQRLLLFWISIVASLIFVVALWLFLPRNPILTESATEETEDIYNKNVGFPELKQAALNFLEEGSSLFAETKEKVGESFNQTKELVEKVEKLQNEQQPTTLPSPETPSVPGITEPTTETPPPQTDTQTTTNN